MQLALQDSMCTQWLRDRLRQSTRSPAGHGHLVNHSCCENHRNTALELRQSEDREDSVPFVCVVATKPIKWGDTILTSYTKTDDCDGLPFVCGCCKCAGVCGRDLDELNGSRAILDAAIRRWRGCDLIRMPQQWRWVQGAPVRILGDKDSPVKWVTGSSTQIWRPLPARKTADIRWMFSPNTRQFRLDDMTMQKLAPEGWAAGAGIRDGGVVYRPE